MTGICCHAQCICIDRGEAYWETASAQAGISWPASKASILAPVTMRAQLRCLTFLATPMLQYLAERHRLKL